MEARAKEEGRRKNAESRFLHRGWDRGLVLLLHSAFLLLPLLLQAQTTNAVRVLATNGVVEVLRSGAATWDLASTDPAKGILRPGDQLRTGRDSRATVRLADRTIAPIGPLGQLMVLEASTDSSGVRLLRGRFFFLHRDDPGRVRIETPTVTAAIRGTEFYVGVDPDDGATDVQLYDGALQLTNQHGALVLEGSGATRALPGRPPEPAPALPAVNVVQWSLYYPAVLFLHELPGSLPPALDRSVEAYQAGDLRAARFLYPQDRAPASSAERIYLAALSLGVGSVQDAIPLMDHSDVVADADLAPLRDGLHRLVDAVQFRESSLGPHPTSVTWLLAESYYQQSRARLDQAREAARQAAELAPGFGAALVRRAEMEFSFGRIDAAATSLERALEASPRHAEAEALSGFLDAARNRTRAATAAFDRALQLDSGLANAWLGRGLCRLRTGEREAGLDDLLTAAAIEPQRAVLRSYLGKALEHSGDFPRAGHELKLARELDPADPTGWLYSALFLQRENRINEAIGALEQSQAVNDNRGVFRSRDLLDQDRAVRGANLANLYEDAGMRDVGYREAVRAVYEDYGNFSTHLFLANSYDQRLDRRQENLRFETPWYTEYLLANLLAPVGAGTLSQQVSREEYSRLFERNHLGIASRTEYLSNGDWHQSATVYGREGAVAFSVGESYRNENGYRPNGDLEQWTVTAQAKVQIDPANSLFFQSTYLDQEGGDLTQHYSEDQVNRNVRFSEQQEPLLMAGYHHQWSPAVHTLFLAARLDDEVSVHNPTQNNALYWINAGGAVTNVNIFPLALDYDNRLEIYSGELQQMVGVGDHQFIAGVRGQVGDHDTQSAMPGFAFVPATDDSFETDFDRVTVYGYYHWRVVDPLLLVAGVSYDRMHYPLNYRRPPISDEEDTVDQVSPKAGLVWTPSRWTTVRGAYAQALGGVSIDQSVRLEPSQVAGFVQSYRSVIPESVAGPVPAEEFEIAGIALDQRFPSRTYVGLSAEWLQSDARREDGVFVRSTPVVPGPINVTTALADERLDYEEKTLFASLHQLVGDVWTVGVNYRLSEAELEDRFTQVAPGTPSFGGFMSDRDLEATLHQVRLFALLNLPCGFFAQADTVYSQQSNRGYEPDIPGDEFWQVNAWAGYRFWHRHAEVSLGVLNITDQDYELNPLNLTPDLPRERTLAARLRFAF